MADISSDAHRKIVNFLELHPGSFFQEIFNGTGIQNSKEFLYWRLNELLKGNVAYSMKGRWFLNQGEQTTRRDVPAGATPHSIPKNQQRQVKILNCLRQQQVPVTAVTIRKSTGLAKKEVNSILYKLKQRGLVVFKGKDGSRPIWSLDRDAMADSGLFRDSRSDTSAPGAYSPQKSDRSRDSHEHDQTGSTLFADRQEHRHSNRSNPYHKDPGLIRHPKPPSGPSNNVAMRTILNSSQHHSEGSNSRPGVASGSSDDTTACSEGLTVSLPGIGGRSVSVVSDDQAQSEAYQNDAGVDDQSGDDDDDDDDDDDFLEDDYDPPDMTSRYQDMMGDLVFEDMTFVEDEEDLIRPEDVLLCLISLEPGCTMAVSKLAQVMEKTREEIDHIVKSWNALIKIFMDKCTLNETGIALAKNKLDNDFILAHHVQQLHDHYCDDTISSPQQAMAMDHTPKGRVPLTPKELIQTDPVFGVTSPVNESGRGRGRGRGRGLLGQVNKPSPPRMIYVRDLEAQSHPAASSLPPLPSSFTAFSSPQSTVTSSVGMASSSHQRETDEGPFRSVDEIAWQPLVPSETNSAGGSMQSPRAPQPSHALMMSHPAQRFPTQGPRSQGMMMTSQVRHPFPHQGLVTSSSQPSNLSHFTSMPTSLQKFTQEGLTVVPKSVGLGYRPPESMEMIEHQMGKTGLTSISDAAPQSAGNLYSESMPMNTSIPRSQSQPLLSNAGAGGDGSMLKITSESFAALNKNPISALMEYAQSRRMQAMIEVVTQRGPSHRPVFLMAARVGNRQFPGVTCHNKKDGRKEAADVALRTLIAEGQYSAATPTPSVNIAAEDMTHFDKIAALTHQTFNSLIASIPENLAGRKVIAGLVMKRGEDDVGVVISIGTGNRCITGDKLSLEGNTVNDSHAEIITRRGFMRFLYQQLEEYCEDSPHNLFEPGSWGKLRVKAGITFHLYISTAPCGDGALFSPRDVESNSGVVGNVERRDHCPTFTSNVQGLLRTKMEGGEGTIPVDTKEVTIQSWDGVVRGERLRTMSCTDKICRWNVLGLQGALLSHFLDPIYLDSLTLGFLYDHGHLSRAVCCRLARDEPALNSMLPSGFHLNHPWLGRVTACQPLRETQKTKAFSINWTVGDPKPEVLDGTLGHCYTAVEKQLFSRVAKRSMYDSFKKVAHHLGRSDLLQAASYRHNKMAAGEFQAAKTAMVKKFQQQGCGWVKKPVEEEMFS